jgi:REP element-mobilizing transposase RayT
MARPLRIEYGGAFYHVTSRGNERRKIFYADSDYKKFKVYLREAQEKYGYLLHSYVLMANHYHLLIETPEANMSQVMHFINGSYTTYINRKRGRVGHLFQGRYKAILIERDQYLLELSRYIHMNPVRAGLAKRPEEYPYSSYGVLIGRSKENFVYGDLIWRMISGERGNGKKRYRTFVEDGIGRRQDSPLKDVYGGAILGGDRFIKEILGRLRDEIFHKGEVSHRRRLRTLYGPTNLIQRICGYFKITPDELRRKKGDYRKMAIYLVKRFTGMTNREIGGLFGGLTYSAVAKAYERYSLKLAKDKSLKRELESISSELSKVKG